MSKQKTVFRTFTTQTKPGSDGRGSARALMPDEIISPSDLQLDWRLDHPINPLALVMLGRGGLDIAKLGERPQRP